MAWRRGFTLVELLVTLTILGLLAAMAVPAIRSAMDRADQTVCLSNLRQLGQAFSEFSADHGHYPAAEWDVTDGAGRVVERKRWYHELGPYLDSSPRAWSSGQGRVVLDAATGTASGVVLPSEDDLDQSAFSDVLRCPSVPHWEVGRNGAYGYNHQYLGDARATGVEDGVVTRRNYPVRPSALADRARTLVLVDSAGTGTGPYRSQRIPNAGALGNHAFTVDPPVLPLLGSAGERWGSDSAVPGTGAPLLPSRPHARHRGGCCVLYADGRVEWVTLATLIASDALWNGTGAPATRAP